MLKLSFVLTVLLVAGVYSDKYDAFRVNNMDNTFSSGKIRLANDVKKDELIPFKPDMPHHSQPLPSPCTGFRAKTKIPHPTEKSKYIQCRDEFHYDVFACPHNGQYNEVVGACEMVVPVLDRCLEEKPCLNDGVCTMITNSTFKCACRPDWTGDRCEIPMNSCVMKPCGPTGECRLLKTTDVEQDYICLCNGRKEYGYDCEEVVPSPCITGEEQFFPFAFSPRAYIQCDGELIYFQSCGSLLYWNQEEKYCDRKRATNVDLTASALKPLANQKIETPDTGVVYEESEELTTPPMTTTTTTTMMPIIAQPNRRPAQRPRIDVEPAISFAPNQMNQRRPIPIEGTLPINNFPEQRIPESQFDNRPIQSSFETSTIPTSGSQWNSQGFVKVTGPGIKVESFNHHNQFMGRPKAEPAFPTAAPFTQLPETTTRFIPVEPINQEPPLRPWQNPSRPDRFRPDHLFRFNALPTTTTTTTTEEPIAESNVAQSFMRGESLPQAQQQSWFNRQNVRFPETTTVEPSFDRVAVTNEERFPPSFMNRFRGEPSPQTVIVTTTTTLAPVNRESFVDSSAIRGGNVPMQQQPSWFNRNNVRFPETTTVEPIIDQVAVTNEERFPPGFMNRFRGEPKPQPVVMPTTTTLAPVDRESSVDSSSIQGGNVPMPQQPPQEPWFSKFNTRLPETTTVEPNFDRVAVTNEERFPPGFMNRFRGEPTPQPAVMTTTTTLAPVDRESFVDSSAIRGGNVPIQQRAQPQQRPPWFSPNNQRGIPTQAPQNDLIEPTTLAATIIRASNLPITNNEEQVSMREITTTTTPPSFHTRAWPTKAFTPPTWQQRQRQQLSSIDPSLLPSSAGRRPEQNPMDNGETVTTSTEPILSKQSNQQRVPNVNHIETTTMANGEFHQGFNAWKAVPNTNQRRSQEFNPNHQPGFWKSRP